jgi:hypothetical protein
MGWFTIGFYCAQVIYTLANREAVVQIGNTAGVLLSVLKKDRMLAAVMLAVLIGGVVGSYRVFTIWQFVAFYATMAFFATGVYVTYRLVQRSVKTAEEMTRVTLNTDWSATEIQDALQQIAEEDYDFNHQVDDKG